MTSTTPRAEPTKGDGHPVEPEASSTLGRAFAPKYGIDSLLIERATVDHVPYLRRLKEAVMASRYRPSTDEDGFSNWRAMYCTDAYFHQILEDPNSLLLCLGNLRDPVGMVVLRRSERTLEVDDLLCLYPRQGDGTRLLTASLMYAEVWRTKKVFIDVYPGYLDTERFLEGHGFTHVGEASNDLGRLMNRFERSV